MKVNPDVVLLQEIPSASGLAQMTTQIFGKEGQFLAGNDSAIMARGKIKTSYVDQNHHFVIGTVSFDGGRELKCISLRLTPPVSRLDVWSTGFWLDHRDTRQTHRRQLQQVFAELGDTASSSALIVGGDFNMTPLDTAFDAFRPHLTDSFARSGLGWGATGTNDWPLFRVDQVWTNSSIIPIQVFAMKTIHSDHRMVVCDVVLQ
jgi:endonuclease/exonuclease/phosphatase family metal-dependent hydrolase